MRPKVSTPHLLLNSASPGTLELAVDGMHCGGCSGRLKKALEATTGIRSVVVVPESQLVTVDFDTACITKDAIRQAVEATGFSVRA